MRHRVNQALLIFPFMTQSYQWTKETCLAKSRWASKLWKRSRVYWYVTFLQMQLRMQVSSKANKHKPCWLGLGQKSLQEAPYWMTSRSQTSQNTWACIEICDGSSYTDLVNMVFPWTPLFKSFKVQMLLSLLLKIRISTSLVVSARKNGSSAAASTEQVRTSFSLSEIVTNVRCGVQLVTTRCISSAIVRASVSEVVSTAAVSLSIWVMTCGEVVPWPQNASTTSAYQAELILNASILKCGVSNEEKYLLRIKKPIN